MSFPLEGIHSNRDFPIESGKKSSLLGKNIVTISPPDLYESNRIHSCAQDMLFQVVSPALSTPTDQENYSPKVVDNSPSNTTDITEVTEKRWSNHKKKQAVDSPFSVDLALSRVDHKNRSIITKLGLENYSA